MFQGLHIGNVHTMIAAGYLEQKIYLFKIIVEKNK